MTLVLKSLGYIQNSHLPLHERLKFVLFANFSIVGMNVSLMWNSVGFYQVSAAYQSDVVFTLSRNINITISSFSLSDCEAFHDPCFMLTGGSVGQHAIFKGHQAKHYAGFIGCCNMYCYRRECQCQGFYCSLYSSVEYFSAAICKFSLTGILLLYKDWPWNTLRHETLPV